MPVLHFRITSAEENIDITRQIHSQNFTFVRSIVQSVAATGGAKPNGGGLNVYCEFLQGYEITSNVEANRLMIPMDESKDMNEASYVQNVNAEDVRNRVQVKVYKFDGSGLATFGTQPGNITSVDLFFEFTELAPVAY
jgi:hypothetical protein